MNNAEEDRKHWWNNLDKDSFLKLYLRFPWIIDNDPILNEKNIVEFLLKHFTKEELETFSRNNNSVTQFYAICALFKKSFEDSFLFFLSLIPQIGNKIVKEEHYYLDQIKENFLIDQIIFHIKSQLSLDKEILLQEVLFKNLINTQYLCNYIANIENNQERFKKASKIIDTCKEERLLPILSSYQKPNTIPNILQFKKKSLESVFLSIKVFPHPDFTLLLEKYESNFQIENTNLAEMRAFFSAVSAYQNEWALEIINNLYLLFKKEKQIQYRMSIIYTGIISHLSPIYADLLFEFWKEDNIITVDVYNYLCKIDESKCKEFAEQFLLRNVNTPTFVFTKPFYDTFYTEVCLWVAQTNGKLISYLFEIIYSKDDKKALDILKNNLINFNRDTYEFYTHKVKQLELDRYVEILFQNLENKIHIVYDNAVKTIKSFKNPKYDQKLNQLKEKYPYIRNAIEKY